MFAAQSCENLLPPSYTLRLINSPIYAGLSPPIGRCTMRSTLKRIGSFAAVLLLLAIPAFAHHSRAQYDMSKVITLKATVTKVDWTNPHTLIYFDVNGTDGTV